MFPSGAAGRRGCWHSWPRTPNRRVFCYANADLRKDQQNDEILRFVEFWKKRTGRLPEELIFDSRLTTYANLNRLNRQDIDFITLRRRSANMLRGNRRPAGVGLAADRAGSGLPGLPHAPHPGPEDHASGV